MKKLLILLCISITITGSILYKEYGYKIKEIFYTKNITREYLPIEHGYYFGGTNLNPDLYIDYSIFIQDYETNILELLSRFPKREYNDLNIKNINGNDFIFLNLLSSKIKFKKYNFEFTKYNDEDYKIFNNIDLQNGFEELYVFIINPLKGNNTLINTLTKIKEIINENKNTKKFSFGSDNKFYFSYTITKNEFELFNNFKVDNLDLRFKGISEFGDEYMLNFIKNNNFVNFHYFGKYFVSEGKFYTHEN